MGRSYMVAGNWKMHGSVAGNRQLLGELRDGLAVADGIDVVVFPPAVYLQSVSGELASSRVAIGAQNVCDQVGTGAFTGEVSGAMLADIGCRYVLVGHSERRSLYGEDDGRVAAKFAASQQAGLIPMLCIGESLAERESSQTDAVLERQLLAVIERAGIAAFERAIIAYEPVWAIGTGRTATAAQAQAAHAHVRGVLRRFDAKIADCAIILYGGSVRPDNAQELFSGPDVDGGLIGGASLKASDFLAICSAARALAR